MNKVIEPGLKVFKAKVNVWLIKAMILLLESNIVNEADPICLIVAGFSI